MQVLVRLLCHAPAPGRLRQKKRQTGSLTEEEKKRQLKNAVVFVVLLLAVYLLGFSSINCFR